MKKLIVHILFFLCKMLLVRILSLPLRYNKRYNFNYYEICN